MTPSVGPLVAVPEVLSFLPKSLRAKSGTFAAGLNAPQAFPVWASVMMADVSGFTALTERFAGRGARGMDQLTLALNLFLGKITEAVEGSGGDVMAFSGDSVLAVWSLPVQDGARQDCVLRAAHCAATVVAALDGESPAEDITLRLRAAVVSGQLSELVLGGQQGRWKHVLSGQPLFGLGQLLDRAQPGQIAVDAASAEILGPRAVLRRRADGTQVIERMTAVPGAAPGPDPAPAPEAAKALVAFLPRVVNKQLAEGQSQARGEIRTLTSMFVSLTGIDLSRADALATIQQCVESAQSVIYRFGGSVHSVEMSDKGPLIFAIFGLPGHAHEDDARRAVLAAHALQTTLTSLWLDSTCGIATGPAYCGPVGAEQRMTYSVLGSTVNHASRLQSTGRYRIACDEATAQAAGGRMSFERMPDMILKGIADPIAVFCPRLDAGPGPEPRKQCLGRESETREIMDFLRQTAAAGQAASVVLRGDAGMGKSSLIAEIEGLAEAEDHVILRGATDPFNLQAPFQGFRRLFGTLFSIDPGARGGGAKDDVMRQLQELPAVASRAPLFSAVLPFEIADNRLTVEMRGAARLDSTIDAMRDFLAEKLQGRRALVIIDDVHWLDSASWALVRMVLRRLKNVTFLLACRPSFDLAEENLAAIASESPVHVLNLQPFANDSVSDLIALSLGAGSVRSDVTRFIAEKSGGNPFYVSELTMALQGSGTLQVADGQARLAIGLAELDRVGFPETIEKTVLARFDRQPPRHQVLLKFASVIGTEFDARLLQKTLPGGEAMDNILADLGELVRDRMIERREANGRDVYCFNHAIARDVVYGTLLRADRIAWHKAIADRLRAEGDQSLLPAVAEHYYGAEVYDQAADCFEASGIRILSGGTDREAIELLEKALECLSRAPVPAEKLRLATIHRHLGNGCNRLGLAQQASDYFEKGLALLGVKWPRSSLAIGAGAMRHFALQTARSLLGKKPHDRNGGNARAIEISYILDHFGHTLFYMNRGPELIFSAAVHVNFAEDAGYPRTLASAYQAMTIVMGIFALHRAARYYQRRYEPLRSGLSPSELARSNENESTYLTSIGEIESSARLLEQALSIARELGDKRSQREFTSLLSITARHLGRLEQARLLRAEFLELTTGTNDQQARTWALIETAESALLDNEPARVFAAIEQVTPLLAGMSAAEFIWANGILAWAQSEAGDHDRARETADKTLNVLRKTIPVAFYTLDGYGGVAEVYLQRLEDDAAGLRPLSPSDRKACRRQAARTIKALKGFVRPFPFARSRFLTLSGRLALASGDRKKGEALLHRACEEAARVHMPLELAQAQLGLAQARPPEAAKWLESARQIYDDCGCGLGLRRTAELAARLSPAG